MTIETISLGDGASSTPGPKGKDYCLSRDTAQTKSLLRQGYPTPERLAADGESGSLSTYCLCNYCLG